MEENKLSIDELIAVKVQQELAKYRPSHRKISDGWLNLREEILSYCRDNNNIAHKDKFYTYESVKQSIYAPIRYILKLSRLDDMTEEQAVIAREVFEYIKNKSEVVLFTKE